MSDEFLKAARQEIQVDLDGLEQVLSSCRNDEHIFNNSKRIEGHLHKIKGLAPMMGQDKIGKVAHVSDIILKHIMDNGTLDGSYTIIAEAVNKMIHLLNNQNNDDIDNFIATMQNSFPEIADW